MPQSFIESFSLLKDTSFIDKGSFMNEKYIHAKKDDLVLSIFDTNKPDGTFLLVSLETKKASEIKIARTLLDDNELLKKN